MAVAGHSLRRAACVSLLALVSIACGDATSGGDRELVTSVRSAMVGAFPSGPEDDFVAFLSHRGEPVFGCGATLVAPNLVVTAKHCLYHYGDTSSVCEDSGDPSPGSPGGFVTTPYPVADLGIYTGQDGRDRFANGTPPNASGKAILDDKTGMLCSHDIAFLLLDEPISGAPLTKLRLGKRPEEGATVSSAGWGQVERSYIPRLRQRRDGLKIRRVGPPSPAAAVGGIVGPKTFETGPGPCVGDSGGPAYDFASGTSLGVIARGLNLDPTNPDSPCLPDTVDVVFVVIADYPELVRAAFSEAKAEPWLEGRGAPGWLKFADACTTDLECEGGRCSGLSDTSKVGTCNVDCAKPGRTCPAGFSCGAASICEAAVAAPKKDPHAQAQAAEAEPDAGVSGCSVVQRRADSSGAPTALTCLAVLACVFFSRRRQSL